MYVIICICVYNPTQDPAGIVALTEALGIKALIGVLQAHKADPLICEGVISSICPLLVSEEAAVLVGEEGGLPLLLELIRAHYQNLAVVEGDMVLLDSLASIKPNQAILLEAKLNTVALVEWGMSSYAQNAIIQECGTHLLETLSKAKNPKKKKRRKKGRVAEEKVQGMLGGAVTSNTELKTLNKMMQNEELALQMLEGGGLKTMASLLQPNTDQVMFYDAADAFMTMLDMNDPELNGALDPDLAGNLISLVTATDTYGVGMDLNNLCGAMDALATMDIGPEMLGALNENSPIEALLKVLNNSDDPELLAKAAQLLAHLCENEDTFAKLAESMDIRQLIQAMRRNIKLTTFLQWAVFILGKLAETDPELKSQIGIEGGIVVVCQIVEVYWELNELLANSLFCLSILASDCPANASFVASCKGVELLIATLDAYPTDSEVLGNAMNLLRLLAGSAENHRETIIRSSGCDSISDVILNNFNNIEVIRMCFRTLGTLATSASNVSAIIKAGGVQGLVAGMTEHTDHFSLINLAMKVLSIFAKTADPESMSILSQEGAVQAIVEAASTYVNNITLEATCFDCLFHMCKVSANIVMVIKQGGASTILQAMEALQYEEKLCGKAMKLLNKLTQSTANVGRLLEAGVTSAVLNVLQLHPENVKIRSFAILCIGRLANGTYLCSSSSSYIEHI